MLELTHNTKALAPKGKVFFVGDLHGYIELFWQGLQQLNFDRDKDIVIAVGDLVDRGPDSFKSLQLLNEPWFYSVAGNHECLICDTLADSNPTKTIENNWLFDLTSDRIEEVKHLISKMHWAIDIRVKDMHIGVLHADIPNSGTWKSFYDRLTLGNLEAINYATWSRRITSSDNVQIPDLDYLVIGHQTLDKPTSWGNVLCIDTSVYVPTRYGKDHGLTFAFKEENSLKTMTVQRTD